MNKNNGSTLTRFFGVVVLVCGTAVAQDPAGGAPVDVDNCPDTEATADACAGDTLYICECTQYTLWTHPDGHTFKGPEVNWISYVTSPDECPEYAGGLILHVTYPGWGYGSSQTITRCDIIGSVTITDEYSVCDQVASIVEPDDCSVNDDCTGESEKCVVQESLTYEHEYVLDTGELCCIVTEVNDCDCESVPDI